MSDREEIMRRWDTWRSYIKDGGGGSWPRDEFESLLDAMDEIETERDRLREALEKIAEANWLDDPQEARRIAKVALAKEAGQ